MSCLEDSLTYSVNIVCRYVVRNTISVLLFCIKLNLIVAPKKVKSVTLAYYVRNEEGNNG